MNNISDISIHADAIKYLTREGSVKDDSDINFCVNNIVKHNIITVHNGNYDGVFILIILFIFILFAIILLVACLFITKA